jgi:hypothetical protein
VIKFVFAQVSEIKAVKTQGVARVSIDLPIEQFKEAVQALHEQRVLLFTGEFQVPQFGVFAVDIDEEEFRHLMDQAVAGVPPIEMPERATRKAEDSLASSLHKNGYFYNRKLWAAIEATKLYTQDEHKKWIEGQSCLLNAATYPEQAARLHRLAGNGKFTGCGGDVVGHHVRTADNSGKAIKPDDWYLVPSCDKHHREMFHDGQTAEMNDELLRIATAYTAHKMKIAMKTALGLATLSGIEQHQVEEFERLVGMRDG